MGVDGILKTDLIALQGNKFNYCDCGTIYCGCAGETKNCTCSCNNKGKCVCGCHGCVCSGYSAEYHCDNHGQCLAVYKCKGLGNICAKSGEKIIIK